jgi:hypothetical protein
MARRSTDEGLCDSDGSLLKKLEEYGWYVIKVGADDSEPAFAYTLGLYENFGHPEIIIFGLDFDTMHQLLNDAGERIRQGGRFEDGQEDDGLLENYRWHFGQSTQIAIRLLSPIQVGTTRAGTSRRCNSFGRI